MPNYCCDGQGARLSGHHNACYMWSNAMDMPCSPISGTPVTAFQAASAVCLVCVQSSSWSSVKRPAATISVAGWETASRLGCRVVEGRQEAGVLSLNPEVIGSNKALLCMCMQPCLSTVCLHARIPCLHGCTWCVPGAHGYLVGKHTCWAVQHCLTLYQFHCAPQATRHPQYAPTRVIRHKIPPSGLAASPHTSTDSRDLMPA